MNHYLRVGQQRPAQERVLEIQRALSAKGYLAGDADGSWDDRTTDALKRFQRDQSLSADGKLSALSLIALGLGPNRGVAPPATKPDLPPAIASARAALAVPPAPVALAQE
ncbi:MAG: peptidoglycan-binding domain-containing protein [Bryobacteraceae bacterium]